MWRISSRIELCIGMHFPNDPNSSNVIILGARKRVSRKIKPQDKPIDQSTNNKKKLVFIKKKSEADFFKIHVHKLLEIAKILESFYGKWRSCLTFQWNTAALRVEIYLEKVESR